MKICAFKTFSSGFSMWSGSIQFGDQTASSRMPRFFFNFNIMTKFSSNHIISGIEFSNTNGPKSLFMDVQRQGNWCLEHFEVKSIQSATQQIILRKCPDNCRSLILDSSLYGEAECQAFMRNGFYRLPAWYASNS